ncbi:MAG: isoprenylcysteine carboxylmethyltransferase family protein [Chloroflexi bacterium]|nr:MAG: isoprenylcysteine carboxylmethyltransferase family protein [Chloroflexota bacterium]
MGSRGEGWVIGQFVIGAAVLAATFFTRVELPLWLHYLGGALFILGGGIALAGLLRLDGNLSPFPKPKDGNHTLVTSGVYSLVRHPIYSGVAIGALGWTLWWGTLLGIALAIVLFIWFDLKARREEKWLVEKYPAYAAYRTRVKKLIPFLY